MPKWTDEYRQQMKEKVRSVLVRKPNISKYELAKVLEIDKDVALRLKKQVIRENTKRISQQQVDEEVGKLEVEYEKLALECWQIITQDYRIVKVKKKVDGKEVELETRILIEGKEKLRAIKTIIEARKILFNIKLDTGAGVFKRKLGELELTKKLNQAERDLIKKAIELDYGKKPKPKPEPETKPEPKPEVKPKPETRKDTSDRAKKDRT